MCHRTNVYETYPAFSPDGRRVAYGSNASGVWEVYVRAFPDNGREIRVSNRGGRIPVWSRTSDEILYETNDHRLMVTSYAVEGRNRTRARADATPIDSLRADRRFKRLGRALNRGYVSACSCIAG